MSKSNHQVVGEGLEILKKSLIPYVVRELQSAYGQKWWERGIETSLRGTIGIGVTQAKGSLEERFEHADVHLLLIVIWDNWNHVFQDQLGHTARSYVSELREVRNNWAHQKPFTGEDAHRALDTMARLTGMTSVNGEEELNSLAQDLLRRRFEADAKKTRKKAAEVTQTGTQTGLKSWREIATPHPDVAAGRYQQAEFAADLFQVITGKAKKEYQDPVEFFNRTFFTEGLTRLVSRAWERLAGEGGDPVVELQTNFGGGKTHSMLVLYHLFSGAVETKDVPDVEKFVPKNLAREKIALPKANRAVLVGTQLSPAEVREKPDGSKIHTIWGEMAWQLGNEIGKGKEAYAMVAEEDKSGISPGSEKITQLFETYGPSLILIDEWVAFARQIYGKDNLPSGRYESNITFVQALTEAAKAAGNTMVVASLPQSNIEKGGEHGRIALEHIQNVFSRVEAVWKPATSNESFEIVRRRLFEPITDYVARDAVCKAFSEMYQSNKAEFPQECREADYEKRMQAAYPIHPELFDRLYEDWSTLERFQRTRGVLRLMASIIHELWERNDGSLMIMPGTLPLDSTSARFEITRYLPEGWSAVLDKDIDGPQSRPLAIDRKNPNLMRYSASRRVTRTIFIGSAPSGTDQKSRGVEEIRVKLGCAQPGETIATFGDALRRLSGELTYLYSDARNYWFDTHPTITRTASDRADQFLNKSEMVEDEITRRLRDVVKRKRGEFIGVHTDPKDSSDVPDDPTCRLVILGPEYPHRKGNGGSKAMAYAEEILRNRGNSPRIYSNMLVFLAPGSDRLEELSQAVRYWLAWTSIQQDEDRLNLDSAQRTQVKTNIQRFDETISARLMETYCYLLIPTQQGTNEMEWSMVRLQGGNHPVERASDRLVRDEELIIKWSPATLRIELDRWLWKEQSHITVKQLWNYLAQYLYLPRLKDEQVLIEAIRDGVNSMTWADYFGYASAVRDEDYYVGLVAGSIPSITLDSISVIVKPAKVKEQREREDEEQPGQYEATSDGGKLMHDDETVVEAAEKGTVVRRFHGSVDLTDGRVGREAGQIADEVLSHLSGIVGAKVTISLEINVEVPDGISEDIIRVVTENANTLKFKSQGFEEQ